jgi:hypothetical protein
MRSSKSARIRGNCRIKAEINRYSPQTLVTLQGVFSYYNVQNTIEMNYVSWNTAKKSVQDSLVYLNQKLSLERLMVVIIQLEMIKTR